MVRLAGKLGLEVANRFKWVTFAQENELLKCQTCQTFVFYSYCTSIDAILNLSFQTHSKVLNLCLN